MFEQHTDFPVAVTSSDDDGLRAGMRWCAQHMRERDVITVWTHLKSNLRNNRQLEQFVNSRRDVEHVTARGGAYMRHEGPVLMAWADPGDIAEFVRGNGNTIKALCVVSWVEAKLRPWVTEVRPELLGDISAWDVLTPRLDPIVEEAMKDLTLAINHNNTISAGYEKDDVVSALLVLHDAGYQLDGAAMASWAIAHGWSGRNPSRLETFAQDINLGRRPRVQRELQPDYVAYLRAKVNGARGE